MASRHVFAGLLIVAATFGMAENAVANESDKREISSYVLTEAGLGKFAQATKNLSAIPGACVDKDEDDDDTNGKESLDQLAAKLESLPGAKAAVQSAGMSSREYVVFMFSMMEAGLSSWAMSQPGGKLPPGVSQANVDFYKSHETALAEIGKNEGCGSVEEDDGDECGEGSHERSDHASAGRGRRHAERR